MKNSFKNNYSRKNSKLNKKDPNSDSYSKNKNPSKKNNKFLLNSTKNFNNSNSSQSDKNKKDFSSSRGRKPLVNSNSEFSKKAPQIYDEFANKKNFDDWIWGKHSVFEALTSERAINRIWCTSEIFLQEILYFTQGFLNLKES